MQHQQLATLISFLKARVHVYLIGPAGSGKTHSAKEAAKELNIPFYFNGAISSEYKLTGFIDAHGKVVETPFRKAYQNGGLFLFDEIDASSPQAMLAFNAALSNDTMDFPDQNITKHNDFYCIAAANTYGLGADRQYVGRTQLDAASLDRFVFLEWNYDEKLEHYLANNYNWTNYVQNVRRYIQDNKVRHVVSPRASIDGAKLIANNIDIETVKKCVLFKGLSIEHINKINETIHYKHETQKPKYANTSKPTEKKPSKLELRSRYAGRWHTEIYQVQKINESQSLGYVVNRENTWTHSIESPVYGTILNIKSNNSLINAGDLIATILVN